MDAILILVLKTVIPSNCLLIRLWLIIDFQMCSKLFLTEN